MLAGDLAAVGAALAQVEQRAAAIGLTLNLAKSEVVALGPMPEAVLDACLPAALLRNADGSSRVLQHFEFLGAAIGDVDFVRAHTEQRVAKAATLLEALAEVQDPQVALRLLRAGAGHTRLVHSQRAALATFDGLVRRCFAGIHPTADQWQQAALGFAQAGLGLRCTAAHAPAAYLASLGSSLSACAELDASFCAEAVTAHVDVAAALAALNAQLPGVRALSLDAALGSKQRQLSERLDAAGWACCEPDCPSHSLL